jgi:hypothetical protein
MTNIIQDLRAYLTDAVPDLNDRLYPLRAPEKFAPPLLVYQVTGRSTDHTFDGVTEYTITKVQLDVYAPTYAVTVTLSDAVVAAMSAWSAPKAVHFDNEIHLDEATVEPPLFRVSLDWSITHDR